MAGELVAKRDKSLTASGSAAVPLDRSAWEQMDRTRQVEAIQAIVERIGYDGTARQVTIRFHPPAITAAGQEVWA
jgi:hypothetical protein